MSVSPSVHLSTIQKVSLSVNKFNSFPVMSINHSNSISLFAVNRATQLINQTLFHQWINHSNSYNTIQKYVDSPFRVLILDTIRDSRFLRESRIKNQAQAIKNQVEDQVSPDRKQKINPWLILNNFTKTYSCNTAQHGYIRASDCMLGKRPIQVVKRMFHQGYLYQASKFTPLSETTSIQTYKQTYFIYLESYTINSISTISK